MVTYFFTCKCMEMSPSRASMAVVGQVPIANLLQQDFSNVYMAMSLYMGNRIILGFSPLYSLLEVSYVCKYYLGLRHCLNPCSIFH